MDGSNTGDGPRRGAATTSSAAGTDPIDAVILACVQNRLFSSSTPAHFGRYRVERQIGTGGMGVVFRAYDPELKRRVAVKLVRESREHDRGRLLREAQALAEVSHPSVVAVYDVGLEGDTLFMGMELVDGRDLSAWLAQRERTWSEVLDVLIQAGEGLAAAHDRGVVHRDIKPANVLIGRDGRVKVADFGVAAPAMPPHTDSNNDALRGANGGAPGPTVSVSRHDGVAGTPAYMAPEQHLGQPADPRADQFALCATVYEALSHRRAFEGATFAQLLAAKRRGLPRPPRGSMPHWLLALLRRGTQADPDQRFPDMRAMLTAARTGAAGREGRGWIAAATLVPVLAVVGALMARQPPSRCDASRTLSGVWGPQQAAAVEEALEATQAPYAEQTARRVSERLDRQARQWATSWARVCDVAGQASVDPSALRRRFACLEARRQELVATVDVLASAAATTAKDAVQVVSGLPESDRCTRLSAAEVPVLGGAAQVQVAALRKRLARASALGELGLPQDGLRDAAAVQADALASGLPEVELEAVLAQGRIEQRLGRKELAVGHFSDAALRATGLRHDEVAAAAAISMIQMAAGWQGQFEAAKDWNRHAVAALERMGSPPVLDGDRLYSLGILGAMSAQADFGLARFEAALALHRSELDPAHPRIAADLGAIADAKLRAGDAAGGEHYAQQAFEATELAFGSRHPKTALQRVTVGQVALRRGDYPRAELSMRQAIADLEPVLGRDSPQLVPGLTGLGAALQRTGRLDEALGSFERAHALVLAAFGENGHPNLPLLTNMLAEIHLERGEHQAALDYADRSLAQREVIHGAEHPAVAIPLLNGVKALIGLGRDTEILPRLQRAQALASTGTLPPRVGIYVLSVQGQALLALGRFGDAVSALEQASQRQQEIDEGPYDRGLVDFQLARALYHDPATRKRALRLGREARDTFASLGSFAPHHLGDVERWLASRS